MSSSFSTADSALLSVLSVELFSAPLSVAPLADYPSILTEAKRHAVAALIYPGLKQGKSVPSEVLNSARRMALASAKAFETTLRAQQEVLSLLQGIPCAVLKGMSVACLYPHPSLRVPGDIDILVNAENLNAAGSILLAAGYTYSHTTDIHTCFEKANADGSTVSIELHTVVSTFPDSEKGRFAKAYMQDALRHTQTAQIGDVTFPVLSGTYQLIALLSHMERHLVNDGIGLRQFCDWAVTVHTQREHIDDEVLAILDRCGLLCFAKAATKMCEKYLGLPPFDWCADVPNDLADALLQDLLARGNFHAEKQVSPFTDALTDAYGDSKQYSTLRSYFSYVRNRMRTDFPWAKSPLWLPAFSLFYPARWTVRLLLGKRKKFSLNQTIQAAQKRETFLKGLRLYR